MSESDDDFRARLSSLESTVGQIDQRLGRVEDDLRDASSERREMRTELLTRIDAQNEELRRTLNRRLVTLFTALTVVFTLISVGVAVLF